MHPDADQNAGAVEPVVKDCDGRPRRVGGGRSELGSKYCQRRPNPTVVDASNQLADQRVDEFAAHIDAEADDEVIEAERVQRTLAPGSIGDVGNVTKTVSTSTFSMSSSARSSMGPAGGQPEGPLVGDGPAQDADADRAIKIVSHPINIRGCRHMTRAIPRLVRAPPLPGDVDGHVAFPPNNHEDGLAELAVGQPSKDLASGVVGNERVELAAAVDHGKLATVQILGSAQSLVLDREINTRSFRTFTMSAS